MSSPVAKVADLVTGSAYTSGWALVRALPEPVAVRLFDAGAVLAARRGGKGVQRLRSNLARVVPDCAGPDLDGLVLDGLRSYARYWREVFRLPVMATDRILGGMSVVGRTHMDLAVASGRGTVFALPHSGNWDQAGAWLVATGHPFTTVAERLRPEALYDRFVVFRQGLGMEVLPLTGGERPPFEVLTERLSAGGVLCLLADRDLTPRGVDVTFFGSRARMPAGPASLALTTGAALVPATLSFTRGGWEVEFHPEVPASDVATMTQEVARAFERGIGAHPADWHMLQRLWLDDLSADDPRRASQAGDGA